MTGDTPKTEETAPQKEALRDDERRIEETRCPYCGGTCVLNAAHTKAICQYCGHTFDITVDDPDLPLKCPPRTPCRIWRR